MARDHLSGVLKAEAMNEDAEDTDGLLSHSPKANGDGARDLSPRLRPPRWQSSISSLPTEGLPRTPRTPNRVRFDLDAHELGKDKRTSVDEDGEWMDGEEDYFSQHAPPGAERSPGQRAPLLTAIEAPSVALANASDNEGLNMEYLPENARPKSGMVSAFMNMANSIM